MDAFSCAFLAFLVFTLISYALETLLYIVERKKPRNRRHVIHVLRMVVSRTSTMVSLVVAFSLPSILLHRLRTHSFGPRALLSNHYSPSSQSQTPFVTLNAVINPDVGGTGVRTAYFMQTFTLLVAEISALFHGRKAAVKEIGLAILLLLGYLPINVLVLRKNLTSIERLIVCMQMDGLVAALSMTFSEKDTLSSRWFIYLAQLMKVFTLIATVFVIKTLPHSEPEHMIHVNWGGQYDFLNRLPTSFWIYGALRILVEVRSSWQALFWTTTFNELEHQHVPALTDSIDMILETPDEFYRPSRTNSRASVLPHPAPMGVQSSASEANDEPNDTSQRPSRPDSTLLEINLHEFYKSWPGTVFSSFLDQFAFSMSALLSAEIVVTQSTVKDALSWGQTASMFTCAAGVLHWLYVQARNIKKSGVLSRHQYPADGWASHMRVALLQRLRKSASKIKELDHLRIEFLYFIALLEFRDDNETTPLIRATKLDDYESVQALLNLSTTQINAKDMMNMTSLLWASRSGNIRIVKNLLKVSKIDPNVQDHEGRTSLSWSVINQHKDVVRELLACPSTDLNLQDHRGRTPLSWAASNGNETMVEWFLRDKRTIPGLADDMGWTPITWANVLGHQNTGIVRRLLSQDGMQEFVDAVLVIDQERRPYSLIGLGIPLLIGSSPGAPKNMVRHLMDIAENLNEHATRRGTMLQSAASFNDIRFCRLLLDKGANVNGDIRQDLSPLQWAVRQGNLSMVKLFLEKHADVDLYSCEPEPAAGSLAKRTLAVKTSRWVKRANRNSYRKTDNIGYGTALYMAALMGRKDIVQLLLGHGASLYERGERGTPLHAAAACGHQDIVRMMLEYDSLSESDRSSVLRTWRLSPSSYGTFLSV